MKNENIIKFGQINSIEGYSYIALVFIAMPMKYLFAMPMAVKIVGISRSTFYKYNDYVFTLTDGFLGKKATISMTLDHHSGILSQVLEIIAENHGNILTISQSTPIDRKANVTITLDITEMSTTFTSLTQELKNIEGVYRFTLDAIESNE